MSQDSNKTLRKKVAEVEETHESSSKENVSGVQSLESMKQDVLDLYTEITNLDADKETSSVCNLV